MEIPDSNDPLGHADGLERPIPTPRGKMNCNFITLLKCKHSSERTRKILLWNLPHVCQLIQVCKEGNLPFVN